MPTPYNIETTAGLPYALTVTVADAKTTWATIGALEVRAQVRAGHTDTSRLLVSLTPFLTPTFVGNDLVIVLSMTGAQTRTLKSGYYDIVVSDTGVTDARGLQAVHGSFKVGTLVTAAADA